MLSDKRQVAIFVVGFCAFLQLWSIQALLPTLVGAFRASEAEVSLTISATTIAIALMAPFIGVVADVLGRRRIIVIAIFLLIIPTGLIAAARTLDQIVLLRFVQGLLLPPVFAVAVAYIGDEFPRERIAAVTATYTTGTILGGFLGRFIAGWVGDYGGWRAAYLVLAAINLGCALIVIAQLPRERHFVRAAGIVRSVTMMVRHFRDPRLAATFAVGFGILFCFVTIFTFINFHLADAPYDFSAAELGSLFVVYLFGAVTMPLTGRLVARLGRRWLVVGAVGLWALGVLLTLLPQLVAIILGLVVAACAGFICQAVATGYVAYAATEARSSAVGLYVTAYYLGGSLGAVIGGIAWHGAGWLGCVVLVWLMLGVMAALIFRFWREPPLRPAPG